VCSSDLLFNPPALSQSSIEVSRSSGASFGLAQRFKVWR